MNQEIIEDQITRQAWVAPVGRALDTLAGATVKRSPGGVKNFLHGTWLGHPLHPAVTDLPVGAFTTATILDVINSGRERRDVIPGADAAVAVGLAGAGLAAASGLADWSDSEQPARRVGVLHAVLNISATVCYLSSLILRRRGRRPAATGTGIVGWLLLMSGAYLGGRMVYHHGQGVDHAQRNGPQDFTAVIPDSELPENEPHRVEVNGVRILLVRQHGELFALGEQCAHLGGPLADGKLSEGSIQCPWHGSRFALADGKVLNGPATYPQPCFEVRVRAGQIEVRANRAKLGAREEAAAEAEAVEHARV